MQCTFFVEDSLVSLQPSAKIRRRLDVELASILEGGWVKIVFDGCISILDFFRFFQLVLVPIFHPESSVWRNYFWKITGFEFPAGEKRPVTWPLFLYFFPKLGHLNLSKIISSVFLHLHRWFSLSICSVFCSFDDMTWTKWPTELNFRTSRNFSLFPAASVRKIVGAYPFTVWQTDVYKMYSIHTETLDRLGSVLRNETRGQN